MLHVKNPQGEGLSSLFLVRKRKSNNPKNVPSLRQTTTRCSISTFFNKMELTVISQRSYGEEKLKPPKAIKGVKPVGIEFIGGRKKKCTFKCYFLLNEIYIKCTDFFSPEFRFNDYRLDTLPLAAKMRLLGIKGHVKGFVYPDGWGAIVLRNEAWLRLVGTEEVKGLHLYKKTLIMQDCFINTFEELGADITCSYHWLTFIENLAKQMKTKGVENE